MPIVDVPGPDPLQPEVNRRRRAAAQKGHRTRRQMAEARQQAQTVDERAAVRSGRAADE